MRFSIGELEEMTGVSRTTFRFYDSEGLITPERSDNRYRTYSEKELIRLVQLKQLNAFGLELSEMPGVRRGVDHGEVCRALVEKQQAIADEIELLYRKLARIQLHVDAYRRFAGTLPDVRESRMISTYRLLIRDGKTMHPNYAAVFRRWMGAAPYTYSFVRIPREALFMPPDALCPCEAGIGLLAGAFQRMKEPLEDPVEYSPPCKCIEGMLRVKDPLRIPRAALEPFDRYIRQHSVIPMADFHAWIVYAPAEDGEGEYLLSVRLGIS